MSDLGFERLVIQMIGPKTAGRRQVAEFGGSDGHEAEQTGGDGIPLLMNEDESARQTEQPEAEATELPGPDNDAADEPDLLPQSLVMSSDEVKFMCTLGPLVRSPRATKRFVNSYQLLRVSVDDVAGFLTNREYLALMLLLAMATGSLELSSDMVSELYGSPTDDLAAFMTDADERWMPLRAAMAGLPAEVVSRATIRRWLPAVARFTFHGHADIFPRSSASPTF
ncbi:MAG TPA: hypothetical protein VFU36_02480 [Jatrophihabitans sp.]|nr:hypothetical protein [Jatrophihabitans sp.]